MSPNLFSLRSQWCLWFRDNLLNSGSLATFKSDIRVLLHWFLLPIWFQNHTMFQSNADKSIFRLKKKIYITSLTRTADISENIKQVLLKKVNEEQLLHLCKTILNHTGCSKTKYLADPTKISYNRTPCIFYSLTALYNEKALQNKVIEQFVFKLCQFPWASFFWAKQWMVSLHCTFFGNHLLHWHFSFVLYNKMA